MRVYAILRRLLEFEFGFDRHFVYESFLGSDENRNLHYSTLISRTIIRLNGMNRSLGVDVMVEAQIRMEAGCSTVSCKSP